MQQDTQTVTTYSAFDALEAIHDFLGDQIAEARPHFEAQAFGTTEYSEEQAFTKALLAAQAIYLNIIINGGNDGSDLIMLLSRITKEYRAAAQLMAQCAIFTSADSHWLEIQQREAQATCAAWGMVYCFVNQQYRRTNAV